MQKIFVKYLCGVVMIALCAMLLLGWTMQTTNAQHRMIENAQIQLERVVQNLENNDIELQNLKASLNEDYLTRASVFAYIIEQNENVLDSLEELNQIKELLNVDELHVINEDGILYAGTVPKYYDMDFRTTGQTKEFMRILEGEIPYLVQDIQPNGAEQKLFQYVGVARKDKPGVVQVGLAPRRMIEAQSRNELPYIFSRVPVDPGESIFAIDRETGTILAHSDASIEGKNIRSLGFKDDYAAKYSDGSFLRYQGVSTFYYMQPYEDMVLAVGKQSSALYEERSRQMVLIFVYFLSVSLVMIFAINQLLKKHIVQGIHKIMGDLKLITDGNLSTVVKVESNPEFKELSGSINKMVNSILEASVKVAKIIDMVDLPIGVFEYSHDSSKVMATDRLRQVLMWTAEETEQYCQDKSLFLQKIEELKNTSLKDEDDTYRIRETPEKWVGIHIITDQSGTFGAVADVTAEVVERRKIMHERDYDALTGLRNIGKFKEETAGCLEGDQLVETAAMVMLDLDCFKGINDQYGHDWGDHYLQLTARFLKQFDGDHGITARRSGDEFCVFLYGFEDQKAIEERMEAFYKEIQDYKIIFPDQSVRPLQISAGLAWYGGELDTYEALMRAADTALYDSKNHRKGLLSCYLGDTDIVADVATGDTDAAAE